MSARQELTVCGGAVPACGRVELVELGGATGAVVVAEAQDGRPEHGAQCKERRQDVRLGRAEGRDAEHVQVRLRGGKRDESEAEVRDGEARRACKGSA